MVTQTEKLEAAWQVIGCKSLTRCMFEEVGAMPDEIAAAVERIQEVKDEYFAEIRKTKMDSVLQQLTILGISLDDLSEYQRNPPAKPRRPSARYIMAIIDGKEVPNVGACPKWLKAKGINKKSEIPKEYWTAQHAVNNA